MNIKCFFSIVLSVLLAPTMVLAVNGFPDFDECASKTNAACRTKCAADGYQNGHCKYRDPQRNGPKIACSWNCTSRVVATDNFNLWDYTDDICAYAFTSGRSEWGAMYPNPHRLYASAPWRGKLIAPWWSAWWHNIANYCHKQGYWHNINFNGEGFPGAITYGRHNGKSNTVSFRVDSRTEIAVENVHTDGCNESELCVRGKNPVGPGSYSMSFNSPYLYVDGLEDGPYEVKIDSEFDNYKSIPPMNTEQGWAMEIEAGTITVANKKLEHLFYELDVSSVKMSRNGINFESKEMLYAYLEDSDFYERLGMNEKESKNSLTYVKEHLKEASNYYLTILDSETIKNISKVEVRGVNGLVEAGRRYFAVYPSEYEIKTKGELLFPEILSSSVKEYGEILVTEDLQVF